MVRKNLAEILRDHVRLELEGIDRMYLNGYVPSLQTGAGFAYFVREQLGYPIASTAMIAPMSRAFVERIEQFVAEQGLDLVSFRKGERKDDVAQAYVKEFEGEEGVLFVGKAQEKASVFRTEKRTNEAAVKYPWVIRSTALVNHYYFYILDRDFGPLFIKFCAYFPYAVKVCLNGHEWLKRQLDKREMAYEALDNGILSSVRMRAGYSVWRTGSMSASSRRCSASGCVGCRTRFSPGTVSPDRYRLSILQAEFALTQVLDRPLTGRCFFEEVIRENLDLGRPDRVQLIFNRRVTRRTPGRSRTRVLTDGVVPSLHVQYKACDIKQYFKENRGLRTETTINNTYDFDIGRSLSNLSALRKIGFEANRRLLRVEQLSHDCLIGEAHFRTVADPLLKDDQRVSGLRFAEPRVMALMQALCRFALPENGFRHRELRGIAAQLLGTDERGYSAHQMTYDLRRLRLHGLIERLLGTHRYRITPTGARAAMLYSRLYARALRPTFSLVPGANLAPPRSTLGRVQHSLDNYLQEVQLAGYT